MKRLFTLLLTAFIFAFTAPVAVHNAAAAPPTGDDAATSATDKAMEGDKTDGKGKHHHKHASPTSENTKTNGTKHTHHKHPHHKHKKADKGADAGADTGK